jgi:putative ATP-dependent endonuclease of the OLD family
LGQHKTSKAKCTYGNANHVALALRWRLGHPIGMQIRQLTIRRYRGIEDFTWKPRPGVNCLVGPGDTFKSTVLAAISLLLAPYPLGPCSEFDFHRRRLADGFEIEAYIGNLDLAALGTDQRLPHLFGWNNAHPVPFSAESVLRCRVRGTADLELVYELPLEGIEQAPPFSSALRRKLMLARLAGEERASRDLRLGTGSLLDRHLKTADMRGSVHAAIADATVDMAIPQASQDALAAITQTFRSAGLPADLHLGLVPTQGNALVGMVALVSGPTVTEAIPLTHAGSGTRQLALISLSAALLGTAPILVIDEPERGLEPYRQRAVTQQLAELSGRDGQVFLTTHSPAILSTLPAGSVWRMRQRQEPICFDSEPLTKLLADDPEAFFCPMPILCEGVTEMGFIDELLPLALGKSLERSGVHPVDGGGQPNVLTIAEAFIQSGMSCSAILDNEATHSGRRQLVEQQITALVWRDAVNIEDAVCKWLPLDGLFALLPYAFEASGTAVRYLEDQIFQAIPEVDRQSTARDLRRSSYPEAVIRAAFYAAMDRRSWFKSREGGRILARTLTAIGMPQELERQFAGFVARLRPLIP